MEINERIRYLRKAQKLTLEEVGRRVGVGKSTVRKWECGDIENMRRDKIEKLARAFDVSPSYLMGWEDDEGTVDIGLNAIEIAKRLKLNAADVYDILNENSDKLPLSDDFILFETNKKILFKRELIENFCALNNEGRKKLVDYSNDLVSSGRYAAEEEDAG